MSPAYLDLIIFLAKYAFLAFIAIFSLAGATYVLSERGIVYINGRKPVYVQRACVFAAYIVGFLIVCLNGPGAELTAVSGLVFFVFAFFITGRVYKGYDPVLLNGVMFLMAISFIILYRLNPGYAQRQLVIAFIAFGATLVMKPIFMRIIKPGAMKWVFFALSIALLGVLFVIGDEQYGSSRWISVSSFSFQPTEIVKLTFVLYLASELRLNRPVKGLIIPAAFACAIVLELVVLKDLGDALILFMTFMILFYAGTGRWRLSLLALGLFCIAVFAAYRVFPHVATRFDSWLNPWAKPDSDGYQVTQSLFAITTWGFTGSGLFKGFSSNIPFVEKDFIFAAVCEEFGPIFGIMMIGVYTMVYYRGVNIALRSSERRLDGFYSMVAIGITGILEFQTFVILGGATGLLPITGVTLPFVSYGGTSVFMSMIMMGFLQNICCDNRFKADYSNDFDEGEDTGVFEEYEDGGEIVDDLDSDYTGDEEGDEPLD